MIKPTDSPVQAPKRLPQLQFLRFLAFVLVFLQHSSKWAVLPPPTIIGQGGMSFFFFLSGFGTGYSAPGKDLHPTGKNIVQHVWKRILKFYPLYFATMFFGIIKSWIPYDIADLNFAAVGKELLQFIKNSLLIQAWFKEGYMSFNGVGWFLSVMIFLYFFNVPGTWILNKINKKKNRLAIFSVAFAGIAAATFAYDALLWNIDPMYWISIFPPSRVGEYLMGMIIGFLIKLILSGELSFRREFSPAVWTIFEATAIAIYVAVAKLPPAVWHVPVVAWIIPNTILLSVFALGKGCISRVFSNRWLSYLGDISSECYLIHQLIITVYAAFFDFSHVSVVGDLFALFFCMITTLIFSHLLHGGKLPQKQQAHHFSAQC